LSLDELIAEIKKNKNYAQLYHPLINRICSEEFSKYKKGKEKIKAVKNRLHIIYGAFFPSDIKNIKDIKNTDETELLKLNASTSERLPMINEFYKFIFDNINDTEIKSVLDVGCGFNPFALPYMRSYIPNLERYYALDIDTGLSEMLNLYFACSGLPELAGCIDVISENPGQKADAAFLFKVIPTIENCKKGRGFELIEHICANCAVKYIIATFPVKTLCGRNKGMAENYAALFEKNINYDKISILAKNIVGNELVYVLAVRHIG